MQRRPYASARCVLQSACARARVLTCRGVCVCAPCVHHPLGVCGVALPGLMLPWWPNPLPLIIEEGWCVLMG